VLAACHPELAASAATVENYPLAHAALAGAFAAALAGIATGNARAFLAAGVAAGLGYLARPDGLVLLAGLAAGVALAGTRGTGLLGRPIAGRALAVAIVALGFTILAVPYVAAIHDATGEWRLTLKKDARHLAGEVDPNAAVAPVATNDLSSTIERIERPGAATRPEPDTSLPRALVYALRKTSEAAHPLVLVLAGFGLWVTRRAGRAHAPGLAIVAAFLGAHALLKAHEGYLSREHAVGEAAIFAALAGPGLLALVPARLRSSRLAPALLLGASAVVLLWGAFDPRAAKKRSGEHAAAEFVRTHAPSGRELVVCGESVRPVAFLAGGRFLELPRGETPEAVARARGSGASFLAFYVRTVGREAEPLRLLEAELARAGLEAPARFREEQAASEGTIVYTWLVYDLANSSGETR
jgi:hypothetical protein